MSEGNKGGNQKQYTKTKTPPPPNKNGPQNTITQKTIEHL